MLKLLRFIKQHNKNFSERQIELVKVGDYESMSEYEMKMAVVYGIHQILIFRNQQHENSLKVNKR